MDDTITLVSTTDSPEEVQAALTGTPVAEKPAEKPAAAAVVDPPAAPAEKPAEKPADAAAAVEPPVTETAEQKTAREADELKASSTREKRKNKIQAEIDDLTRQKYDVRRDADDARATKERLQREIEELEAKKQTLAGGGESAPPKAGDKPAEPAVGRAKPKLDDVKADGSAKYASYEEWMEDTGEWFGEQARVEAARIADAAIKKAQTVDRERIDHETTTRADDAALAKHAEKLEGFRASHADFDAVMEDAVDVVAEIKSDLGDGAFNVIDRYTVHDADHGSAIIYHLAQHPEEMRRIAGLSVPMQIKALAQIDARLDSASKPGPEIPATPVTKAPEPIKPVGSTPTASTVSPDDEDYRVYADRRNAQERARVGR